MGPAGDNFGNVFFRYFFAQESSLGSARAPAGCLRRPRRRTFPSIRRGADRNTRGACAPLLSRSQFLFQPRYPAVLDFARCGQFTSTLRALELGAELIKFFFPFPLFFEDRFLFLPFGFERGRSFF